MDFFVYSRDADGTTLRDDEELLEQHWSYMDAFAESMIARGPTLAADRETATGSLHVLGLPSVDAVREFVAREPNNRAGVYAEHSVWRFENLLGRTMWAFPGVDDEPRFLVIARSDRAQAAGPISRPIPERPPARPAKAADPLWRPEDDRGLRTRRCRVGGSGPGHGRGHCVHRERPQRVRGGRDPRLGVRRPALGVPPKPTADRLP